MKKPLLSAVSLSVVLALSACSDAPKSTVPAPTETAAEAIMSIPAELKDNVLLQEYQGPYGGVPAFEKMDLAMLKPALEFGMKKNLLSLLN